VVDCDLHQGKRHGPYPIGKTMPLLLHPPDGPLSFAEAALNRGYRLWAGEGDEGYLAALRSHFPRCTGIPPDLVIYLAGGDPTEGPAGQPSA